MTSFECDDPECFCHEEWAREQLAIAEPAETIEFAQLEEIGPKWDTVRHVVVTPVDRPWEAVREAGFIEHQYVDKLEDWVQPTLFDQEPDCGA